jgi:hypothetical protein
VYGLRIPPNVLLHAELASASKIVYGLLAASGPSYNPALSQISATLGMSKQLILQSIAELEAHNLITAVRPKQKFKIEGRRRYVESTHYTVWSQLDGSVWIRPGRVQRLVQATPYRRRVLTLLLHVYDRYNAESQRPRPSHAETASALRISHSSAKRARRFLSAF